jgi:protein SCO1
MQQKKSNKKFFIGMTVAVVLPLSFYIVAKIRRMDHIDMPRYYNTEKINSHMADGKMTYDTVYHKVKEVQLINQSGDRVSLNKDLAGKNLLINVFFSRCGSVCPKLTGNMTILQRAFKKNDTTVQLLSISVDPEYDSVTVLGDYARRFGANPDHWWFLTGDRNTIYDYVRNELKILVRPSDGGAEQQDHSQTIVLLDKDRYIRGYYDGLDTAELKRCADDIGLLSMEKKRRKK